MLSVTPNPLVQGEVAQVCVSGSTHGGAEITVKIDDGEGHTSSVKIQLDGNGHGCADWPVENWEQAKFNYSTCEEEVRSITQPAV